MADDPSSSAPVASTGATVTPIVPKKWTGSVYSNAAALPDEFVRIVKEIEAEVEAPVWMFIQSDPSSQFSSISTQLCKKIIESGQIDAAKPVALLLDSGGGSPEAAYQLARYLQKHCGEFYVLVPSYAKSAATLLSLGADKIVLGSRAELGPLDMQLRDFDEESEFSALNHVQTLERLRAFALVTMDAFVALTVQRSGKRISTVLPLAMEFSNTMIRPLMENVDVVRYTEMSRILKIGEDYARRLLIRRGYKDEDADNIAAALVGNYPDHSFVIDAEECEEIGLDVEAPSVKLAKLFEQICPLMDNLTVHGKLVECGSGK